MAEIEGGGGGKKKGGKPHSKKQSTRVDFTPMVDLGFLLITFFMLTTSMNKPKTMEITMPDKDIIKKEDEQKIKASQAVTLILTDKNKLVYYFVDNEGVPSAPSILGYGKTGIRQFILAENRKRNSSVDSIPIYKEQFKSKKIEEAFYKKNISRIKGFKDGLIVIIKSDENATYGNLVDVLDEMLICNVGRYAVVDEISAPEKEMLALVQTQINTP